MIYKLNLKLYYYNHLYLIDLSNNLIKTINLFFTNKEVNINKIYFPKKNTIITVLKSPHVSKKSREQFKKSICSIGLVFIVKELYIFNYIKFFLVKILKSINCKYNLTSNFTYEKKNKY